MSRPCVLALPLLAACSATEPPDLVLGDSTRARPVLGRPIRLGHVSLTDEASLEALCDDGPISTDNLALDVDTITDTRALGCVVEVRGDLIVRGDALLVLTMPGLRRVRGGFYLSSVDALRRLDFPRLVEIGQDVSFSRLDAMDRLTGFPALSSVGGTLTLLTQDSPLSIMTFGALRSAGGLVVQDDGGIPSWWPWSSLARIEGDLILEGTATASSPPAFPLLTDVGGNLIIDDYAAIGADLSAFPALVSVGEDFEINSNDSLESLHGLDSLAEVGEQWEIGSNAHLVALGGPTTARVSVNQFRVYNNDALTSFAGLPWLEGLQYLDIQGNAALREIDVLYDPASVTSMNDVSILDNPLLASIDGLAGNVYVHQMTIDNAAITDLSPLGTYNELLTLNLSDLDALTSFAGMEGLPILRDLLLSDNDQLQDVSALAGTTGIHGSAFGDIEFENNPQLSNADIFEGRSSANTVQISGSPLLDSIATMAGFTHVNGDVYLVGTGLNSLQGLDAVQSIEGDLTVHDVADSDHLRSLQEVEGAVDLEGVGQVQLDALLSLGGTLDLVANPALEAISAPLLQEVGGSLLIKGNPALTLLDLASLRGVGEYLTIEDSTPAILSLPALEEVGINLNLRQLDRATHVELDSLESLPGHLEIIDNDLLLGVSAPVLGSIATDLRIEDNPAFVDLAGLSALSAIGDDLSVQRNGGLTDAEAEAWAEGLSVGGATTIAGNGD